MSEEISVYNMFSPGLSLEFSCIEPIIQWTNLSSYCDAKIRASDKDLSVFRVYSALFVVYQFIL